MDDRSDAWGRCTEGPQDLSAVDLACWADNATRLRALRQEDPVFWALLQRMADIMARDGAVYMDDHGYGFGSTQVRRETLRAVNVCQRLDHATGAAFTSTDAGAYDTSTHPKAWIFPGGDVYSVMCKNNLYIHPTDGALHLTRCATGVNLTRKDMQELVQGKSVVLREMDWAKMKASGSTETHTVEGERVFCLPVSMFQRIVLGNKAGEEQEKEDATT
jgi:hypothetical protein